MPQYTSVAAIEPARTTEEALARRAELCAALRSGHYDQGREALKLKGEPDDHTRYCCQGVACELVIPSLFVFVPTASTFIISGTDRSNKKSSYWPYRLAAYYAICETDSVTLAYRNDAGASFSHIADMIETMPVVLQEQPTI